MWLPGLVSKNPPVTQFDAPFWRDVVLSEWVSWDFFAIALADTIMNRALGSESPGNVSMIT
jgi:hypothetical protein